MVSHSTYSVPIENKTMFNSPKEIDNETNNDSTSVNTAEPRCL